MMVILKLFQYSYFRRLLLSTFILDLIPISIAHPLFKSYNNGVQIGIVPVFGGRSTIEPITFTFTTPLAKNSNSIKPFPTLKPYMNNFAPTIHNNNVKNPFHFQEFKFESQKPFSTRSNYELTTPAYTQALQYKAMQQSLQQDVYSTYRTLWKQWLDTWLKMRNELYADGQVEHNMRMLWNKLTGTVEPYMDTLSNQFGKIVNVFLKHQQANEIEDSKNRFIVIPKRKESKVEKEKKTEDE